MYLMNTFVLQLEEGTIQHLIQTLKEYQVQNANPYIRFAAKFKQAAILIYASRKVVFQGKNASAVAQELGYNPVIQAA